MTMRPCLECGEPTEGSRCEDHQLHSPKISAAIRGYDEAWNRLSRRARRLQPFCEDCGTTKDLTTDHSPEAWKRKAQGKAIRLQDVAVVCRSCNSKRGRAKPGGTPRPAPAPNPADRQSFSQRAVISNARGC